jgi:LacI family transcriptional regulator
LVTIKDVARAVGVSTTTVTNVIHGNVGRVSPEMVARIQASIEHLGYVPNMSARALVNNASRIIGVINHLVPLTSGGFFQDPFHGALLAGIEQTLREREYYMMVRTIDNVPELLLLLNNWNLDGLILTGIFPTDFYESLMAQKTPILLIDSYIQNDQLQVRLEDTQGGYLGTKHLLECGHRDILFCGPPILEEGVLARRFKGYCQAFSEFSVPVKMENVYQREIGIEQGTALGRELAKRHDYTAIFATADILAAGLISGLQEAGRKVPEDISIVGFDDLNIARLTSPQLTTVHQDVVEKGVIAARMLIDALQGNSSAAPRSIVLPVRLVSRQSVRRLNH